jgi:hypothetical protein
MSFRDYKISKAPPVARRILPPTGALDTMSLYLQDIGDHSYMSPEEEKEAMSLLRHPRYTRPLRPYLDK